MQAISFCAVLQAYSDRIEYGRFSCLFGVASTAQQDKKRNP